MFVMFDVVVLCKMVDCGQIEGGVLDGLLVFDNVVFVVVVCIKGIVLEVVGQVDVLVVFDLESGNMFVKQLEYLGGVVSVGIVFGVCVFIVLISCVDLCELCIVLCVVVILLVYCYCNLLL